MLHALYIHLVMNFHMFAYLLVYYWCLLILHYFLHFLIYKQILVSIPSYFLAHMLYILYLPIFYLDNYKNNILFHLFLLFALAFLYNLLLYYFFHLLYNKLILYHLLQIYLNQVFLVLCYLLLNFLMLMVDIY